MNASEFQGKSYLEIMFIDKMNEMVDAYYRKCQREGIQPKMARKDIYKILPLMTSPNTQEYLEKDFNHSFENLHSIICWDINLKEIMNKFCQYIRGYILNIHTSSLNYFYKLYEYILKK